MMKKTIFAVVEAIILVGSAWGRTFLEEASLDSLSALYDQLLRDNLSNVFASGQGGTVTNVFPVYMAGYLHSPLAIPVLLERIDWPGMNEPESRYYKPIPEGGIQSVSDVRLTPSPFWSKPPTPSVGALTQMPVDWPTLQAALGEAIPDSERCRLLAWVASVRHPEDFSAWLAGNMATNSTVWANLAAYSATNLVGRKPYYMGGYAGCWGFSFHSMISQYKMCVEELRQRACTAEISGRTNEYNCVVSVLNSMSEPVRKPTFNEEWESTEHAHEAVSDPDLSSFEIIDTQ